MLENGALVVEWAEKIQDALPPEYLWIAMRWMDDEQRGMVLDPRGARYKGMLMEFRRLVFGG